MKAEMRRRTVEYKMDAEMGWLLVAAMLPQEVYENLLHRLNWYFSVFLSSSLSWPYRIV
jgi:hypothetical protein